MNILKRLFKSKEKADPTPVSYNMSVSEFRAWVDSSHSEILKKTESFYTGRFPVIESSLKALEKSNRRLINAPVVGTFDIRIVKRAKSNRENVMKQVEFLSEKLKTPQKRDIPSLSSFNSAARLSFQTCMENMGKSFYYTKAVFPYESADVADHLESVGQIIKNMNEEASAYLMELEKTQNAVESLKEYERMNDMVLKEEKNITSKKNHVLDLKYEKESISREIKSFEESDAGKAYKSLRNDIEKMKNEEKKALENLQALLRPLFGHLSSLTKLHESGRYTLSPDLKKQVDMCWENFECLDDDFFKRLKKIFEDEHLDIQLPKKEKARYYAEYAELYFPSRKQNVSNVRNALKQKQRDLLKTDVSIYESLFQKETDALNQIKSNEEEIESLIRKCESLIRQKKEAQTRLENAVLLLDKKIEIKF